MNYNFYLDRKVTVWMRDSFIIEADSKEEAIAKVKAQYEEEKDDFYMEGETEVLFETEEPMSVEENKSPTLEIYFNDEDPEFILDNRDENLEQFKLLEKLLLEFRLWQNSWDRFDGRMIKDKPKSSYDFVREIQEKYKIQLLE